MIKARVINSADDAAEDERVILPYCMTDKWLAIKCPKFSFEEGFCPVCGKRIYIYKDGLVGHYKE